MDQFIFVSLSHTHYWYSYEVGMLKVPAEYASSGIDYYVILWIDYTIGSLNVIVWIDYTIGSEAYYILDITKESGMARAGSVSSFVFKEKYERI